MLFIASALGTFPLFVPPFFLPLYTTALGLSSATGAGLVAGFSLASAVGRIFSGMACDRLGSVNVLFVSLVLTSVSMLALWPASESLGPLVVFVLINGASNGGFFSTMPTVVGNVFGSARLSVAMSMVLTGWVGGYLMVSSSLLQLSPAVFPILLLSFFLLFLLLSCYVYYLQCRSKTTNARQINNAGITDRRLPSRSIRRGRGWVESVSASNVVCRIVGNGICPDGANCPLPHQPVSDGQGLKW